MPPQKFDKASAGEPWLIRWIKNGNARSENISSAMPLSPAAGRSTCAPHLSYAIVRRSAGARNRPLRQQSGPLLGRDYHRQVVRRADVSVFIDIIARPLTPFSYAGVAWRSYRRAFYCR
jgi:hypothetical protein